MQNFPVQYAGLPAYCMPTHDGEHMEVMDIAAYYDSKKVLEAR
jgi:hypothetical protein